MSESSDLPSAPDSEPQVPRRQFLKEQETEAPSYFPVQNAQVSTTLPTVSSQLQADNEIDLESNKEGQILAQTIDTEISLATREHTNSLSGQETAQQTDDETTSNVTETASPTGNGTTPPATAETPSPTQTTQQKTDETAQQSTRSLPIEMMSPTETSLEAISSTQAASPQKRGGSEDAKKPNAPTTTVRVEAPKGKIAEVGSTVIRKYVTFYLYVFIRS